MHPNTPTKILDQVIKKHNLKRIIFHELQHTNVTLMTSKWSRTQIINREIGHSLCKLLIEFILISLKMNLRKFSYCKN